MTTGEFEGVGDVRPYQGTAYFYAENRDRPSVAFVDALAEVLSWSDSDRVLDLGTGPGQIALPLAARLGEVVAADPEEDMLAEGRRRAEEQGIGNVTFVQASSDDLSALGDARGQFRAVTIGSAFHWMRDQDRVLRDLDPFLNPLHGAVAIVGWDVSGPVVNTGSDHRPWRDREPWFLVRDILDRHLAGTPEGPHPAGRHDPFEEILARSPFSDISLLRWEYEREVRPSVAAAIGNLYSVSNVLRRLGDRREAFETEARAALEGAPTEAIRERVVDSALIGTRPASGTPNT